MAMITLVVGSVGLCAAGLVAWYAIWRPRVTSSLQRVPVRTDRSTRVMRGSESDDGIA